MARGRIFCTFLLGFALATTAATAAAAAREQGLRFDCSAEAGARLQAAMPGYLLGLGIRAEQFSVKRDARGSLLYTLAGDDDDTNTLDLTERSAYGLQSEFVSLPRPTGSLRQQKTVSKKEIVLALLQRGRLTVFPREACEVEALHEHVSLRQHIVAWAEELEFTWPDGGPASWNERYWNNGTPHAHVSAYDAVRDAFRSQHLYAIGCYTALKLVMLQGMLNFYTRAAPHYGRAAMLEARLRLDGEPLVNLEPGAMWSFEADFDAAEALRPGKAFGLVKEVAPRNYVPGDWAYFLNTDPASAQKTGYEGSNAIYLGGGRFVDLYNDNDHSVDFEDKLDDIYQWRHEVFNSARDKAKKEFLDAEAKERLALTPAEGGLVPAMRAVPLLFGRAALPVYAGWKRSAVDVAALKPVKPLPAP